MTKKELATLQNIETMAWYELAKYDYENAPRTEDEDEFLRWECTDTGHREHLNYWCAMYDALTKLGIESLFNENAHQYKCMLWEERHPKKETTEEPSEEISEEEPSEIEEETSEETSENVIAESEGQVINDHLGIRENMNWSSIYTALIKESANCDAFSSDILIDIDSMKKDIQNALELRFSSHISRMFGFRSTGIDHDSFIESRGIDSPEYRTVWRIDIEIDTNSISAKLVMVR